MLMIWARARLRTSEPHAVFSLNQRHEVQAYVLHGLARAKRLMLRLSNRVYHCGYSATGRQQPAAAWGRASTASMVAQVLGRIVAQIVTAMRVGFVALCSGPDCGRGTGETSQNAMSKSPPAQMGAEWRDRS